MKRLLALLLALAGIGLLLSRLRRRQSDAEMVDAPDPRALDLRRKLDATRREPAAPAVDESGLPVPVEGPDAAADLSDARRRVHEHGRAAVDEMRRAAGEPAEPA